MDEKVKVEEEVEEDNRNIFGIKVQAVDDSMETIAPNLETLTDDEKPPEQIGFNPFADDIYSSGKLGEKKEEIESFVLDDDVDESEDGDNVDPTKKDIPYNKDTIT